MNRIHKILNIVYKKLQNDLSKMSDEEVFCLTRILMNIRDGREMLFAISNPSEEVIKYGKMILQFRSDELRQVVIEMVNTIAFQRI